jgi:hypothetical protein
MVAKQAAKAILIAALVGGGAGLGSAYAQWIGDRTRNLEGVILYLNDSWQGVGFLNCQPWDATAEFTDCTSFMRLPQGTQGPVVQNTCVFHENDPVPWLPPGDWVETHGRCPKGWAAVCTRTQFDSSSGGGDAGCDSPGLLPGAGGGLGSIPALRLSRRCRVKAAGQKRCGPWKTTQ